MAIAFSPLHCKKFQGEISSEQIKTLSSVQHGSAGDRNIWINRREAFLGEVTQRFNNYLFSVVKKIALIGFDYCVENQKRMKRAEAQIIPRGVRNTCVCKFLTPSQGWRIQGTQRVREIVIALLLTM